MRCINTFTTEFDTNTALNEGNLVLVDGDARTFRITSPRYQSRFGLGTARHSFGIKRAAHGLSGWQQRVCLMPESGACPRPLGPSEVLVAAC